HIEDRSGPDAWRGARRLPVAVGGCPCAWAARGWGRARPARCAGGLRGGGTLRHGRGRPRTSARPPGRAGEPLGPPAAAVRAGGRERERLLMLAVLEDAVDCYQKYAHARDLRGRQLFEESLDWVQSPDRTWLFSFENICDTLEISAEYVRRGLREWRARGGRRGRIVALPATDGADLTQATA